MVRVLIKEKNHAYFLDFLNNEIIVKMLDYDYLVKVVLSGDDTEGKAHLASIFSKSYFRTDYKYTIDIGFHVNIISVLGKTIKM